MFQVVKNKIAPPFRVVDMDILFGTGIDTVSCLLDAAEDAEIFTRKGSWYSYEGNNVAQVSHGIARTRGLLRTGCCDRAFEVVPSSPSLLGSMRMVALEGT